MSHSNPHSPSPTVEVLTSDNMHGVVELEI